MSIYEEVIEKWGMEKVFSILLWNKKNGGYYRQSVIGFPIRIPGIDFLEFFVHKHEGNHDLMATSDLSNFIEFYSEECKGKYMVSEAKTGMYCIGIFDSPKEAAHALIEKVNELGRKGCLQKFKQAEKIIKKHGGVIHHDG